MHISIPHRIGSFQKFQIRRYRKNVTFKFKDKGIGIKQDELKNIFKKFYPYTKTSLTSKEA